MNPSPPDPDDSDIDALVRAQHDAQLAADTNADVRLARFRQAIARPASPAQSIWRKPFFRWIATGLAASIILAIFFFAESGRGEFNALAAIAEAQTAVQLPKQRQFSVRITREDKKDLLLLIDHGTLRSMGSDRFVFQTTRTGVMGNPQPVVAGCEIQDDPLKPICWRCNSLLAEQREAVAFLVAGGLSVPAILDYLELWDTLENVQLLENQPDQHLWTPVSSGTYSARSAYARFFVGSSGFEPYKRLWKSWAPLRCKIFLWLAMLNRCWTADRLARQGLQHPDKCLLCDQEEERVPHILTSCVFARQVWTTVLGRVGLQHLAPTLEFDNFKDW